MKTTIRLLILFLGLSLSGHAQDMNRSEPDGGEYIFEKYDAQHPEITPQQYEMIEKRCNENVKLLGLDKITKSNETVLFDMPVKAASGLSDCGYQYTGANVDQDNTTGSIKDYNCGTNTYDGHKGTDFVIWPFGFYKMDNSQVEIIAAAPGTIIDKHDGEFDRNCNTNTLTANYVIIQHADGSRSLYWHMKSGTVTTKATGQPVAKGEYLGIVGSSGSSSGPHLHFEVWSGSTLSTCVDPFSGTCNTLNSNSYWVTQPSYTEARVLKASVHTTDIVMAPCPNTGTLEESTLFPVSFQGVGLPTGYAKFYVFLIDASVGSNLALKILNPDGSVFDNNNWTYTPTLYYKASYLGWSKKLPTVPGVYAFQTTYNAVVCNQSFTVSNSIGIAEEDYLSHFQVFPNPANDNIYISADNIENGNYKFVLKNLTGQTLMEESANCEHASIRKSIPVSGLSNGLYFLTIEANGHTAERKIIIQK